MKVKKRWTWTLSRKACWRSVQINQNIQLVTQYSVKLELVLLRNRIARNVNRKHHAWVILHTAGIYEPWIQMDNTFVSLMNSSESISESGKLWLCLHSGLRRKLTLELLDVELFGLSKFKTKLTIAFLACKTLDLNAMISLVLNFDKTKKVWPKSTQRPIILEQWSVAGSKIFAEWSKHVVSNKAPKSDYSKTTTLFCQRCLQGPEHWFSNGCWKASIKYQSRFGESKNQRFCGNQLCLNNAQLLSTLFVTRFSINIFPESI